MKKILSMFLLTAIIIQGQNSISLVDSVDSFREEPLSVNLRLFPQQKSDAGKKSAGMAIIYSLLLPGMGELYADSWSSGKYFTMADAVFWGFFAGFNAYGNWQEDNYRAFAKSSGDVSLDGKDADYFANIGLYEDVYDYNRIQELNRDFENTYNVETHYWKWTDNSARKEYRNTWTSSERAYNNIRFAVGALILNRLVSAINAVRLVSAYNKKQSTDLGWYMSVGYSNELLQPNKINFTVTTPF